MKATRAPGHKGKKMGGGGGMYHREMGITVGDLITGRMRPYCRKAKIVWAIMLMEAMQVETRRGSVIAGVGDWVIIDRGEVDVLGPGEFAADWEPSPLVPDGIPWDKDSVPTERGHDEVRPC